MSEQDPFVVRSPQGVVFSYGNVTAAHGIDVDAAAHDPIAESRRVDRLPDPEKLTVGDLIKVISFMFRTPPNWRAFPVINDQLLRRQMMLSASPGWNALEKFAQRKFGCDVTLDIAKAFRGELCRLLGKDFDAVNVLPLVEWH